MTDKLLTDLASGALADTLTDLPEAAGRLILGFWRQDVAVQTKADHSSVTEADQAAETVIVDGLMARYLGIQVVAQESAARDGLPDRADDLFWLIDPLDGTRGFVRGVSISASISP